jgi:hypothetical protein
METDFSAANDNILEFVEFDFRKIILELARLVLTFIRPTTNRSGI